MPQPLLLYHRSHVIASVWWCHRHHHVALSSVSLPLVSVVHAGCTCNQSHTCDRSNYTSAAHLGHNTSYRVTFINVALGIEAWSSVSTFANSASPRLNSWNVKLAFDETIHIGGNGCLWWHR